MLLIALFGILLGISIIMLVMTNILCDFFSKRRQYYFQKQKDMAELYNNRFDMHQSKIYNEYGRKEGKCFDMQRALFSEWHMGSVIAIILTVILLGGSLLALWCCRSNWYINSQHIENQNKYNTIIEELTNDQMQDVFLIRTKDVVDDVNEWNTAYQKREMLSKNIWIGVYNPMSVYDGTKYIDIKEYIK